MIPTPRLAALALVVGVSLWFYPGSLGSTWTTLLVVNAVLLLVAVADAFAGVAPRCVVVHREHPPVAHEVLRARGHAAEHPLFRIAQFRRARAKAQR